jgi:D-alanyl-D-alanine carboxypeptidase
MKNKRKTPRVVRILRIIMPIIGLSIGAVIAPLDLLPPLLAPLPANIDEQLEEAVGWGLDGIILYIDRDDRDPEFYAAGYKNKRTGEAADPHSLFKIGSIHKLYLAAAAAQLAADGRLDLDGTLGEYLPEISGRIENADRITVRMMVQHRSGIPEFIYQPGSNWFTAPTTEDENLALVLDTPADFEPGARYAYSNTNYLLLGRILDRLLGYRHHQYVYDMLSQRLGLESTYFTLEEADPDLVASGYWYKDDTDLKSRGGSMIASARDVGIFLRALNDGTFLSPPAQEIYRTIYEFEHDGWVPGYHSKARYLEEMDAVVVQFVSTTGGETWGTAEVIGGKSTAISNIVYRRILRLMKKGE